MDPKFLKAARELRDRYLEQVNRDPSLLLPAGKYDVSRALPDYGARGEDAGAALVEEPEIAEVTAVEVRALPAITNGSLLRLRS